MKPIICYTTLLLIIVSLLIITTDSISAASRVKDTTSAQSLESSDWFSKVKQTIKKEEYYITYSEGVKAYQSPNRAQNLRFIYAADGFTVKPRTTKIPLFDQNDCTLRVVDPACGEEEKQYQQIWESSEGVHSDIPSGEDWQIKLQVAGYGRDSTA